jgi:HK97 family phage prohead protease
MKLETRNATITRSTADDEAREFDALAVPYSEEYRELWPGYFERFAPGALQASPNGIRLRLEHRETIGTVPTLDNRADGAYITAKISHTRSGDDAYELAKDGALNTCSIGFRPERESMQTVFDGEGNAFVTVNRATLIEVSLVTDPAYDEATVTAVRSKERKPMDPELMTKTEAADLRSAIEELSRKVALASQPKEPASPPEFLRSAGAYMKAAATGDNAAVAMATRASADLAGLADGHPRPAWIDKEIKLMDAKMRLTNLFTHSMTLPQAGNVIEFPELESNTVAVSKQDNEGDTLSVGKVKFTSGSAPVCTYGGYSTLSRQVIERSSEPYLDTVHRAQALAYATTIETATRTLFKATNASRLTGLKDEEGAVIAGTQSPIKAGKTTLADLDVKSLTSILIDMALWYDTESIYTMSGLIISTDVAKFLAQLPKTETALQWVGAPDGRQGTITIETPRATLAGINAEIQPSLDEGTLSAYSVSALEILESPGAPARLTQENVKSLTSDISVYGYAAHYAPAPSAILPVRWEA